MEGIIFEAIGTLVNVVIGILAVLAMRYLLGRYSIEEMDLIRKIVIDGVKFSQQVYGHLDGRVRYERALDRISAELSARGIEVSEERLNTLIESAVKTLKAEFKEHWPEGEG